MTDENVQLAVDLEARIRDFERNMERANRTAQRRFGDIEKRAKDMGDRIERSMSTAADRSNANLDRLGKGVASVTASLKASVAGFAAGIFSAGLIDNVRTSAAELAKIADVAERTGQSSRFIQEFAYAVEMTGGEADDAGKGLEKFSVNVSKAAAGGGDLAKVFEANGVAIRDAAGRLRPLEELLGDFAELVKNAESEQDRLNLAAMAFGRGAGPALVVALSQGRAGLAELAREAHRAGVVLGDELVQKGAKLDDELLVLTKRISGLGKEFAVEFGGPAVEAGMKVLLGYLAQVKKTIEDIRSLNFTDLIIRPEVRSLLAGDAPQLGPLHPDQERAELERQQANIKARIATAEARIAAATAAGRGAAGSEAQLAKLKTDLAEIERRIAAINANPLKPVDSDFMPSRAGYTAGSARATIVPGEGGSGGGSAFADGDAIAAYVRRVIAAESGGRTNAKNPDSSATGVGQFIESTWLSLFKKHYPTEAATMGRDAILSLRTDADISKKLIEEYAKQNAETLRTAGVSVNEAALHLSHFLGAGDAVKVLKAAPGTPLRGLISPASIAANPTILGGGRTTDDAIRYADRRANSTRLAAGDRTDAEQAADRQAQAVKRVLEALGLEADQIGKTAQQSEILQRLQQAGVDLNSKEGQAIRAKVAELYALKNAQDRVEQSAEAASRARETIADMGAEATTSILQDLRNGASAAEAFGNALGKIADQLIEMAIKNLFQNAFAAPGGTMGGGLGIFGFIGKLFGFADGGFTGAGGKYEPAGVVHRGEYVMSAEATKRIGVDKLEALHRAGKGYANGGLVGAPSFTPRAIAPAASSTSSNVITLAPAITVNASGGTAEQNNDLAKRVGKEVENNMRSLVGDELLKQLRPGGMLDAAARRRR